MPLNLPTGWTIALNVGGWPVIHLGLAWAARFVPLGWLKRKTARWTGARATRIYERGLLIKRWKDWLPDGGRWLGGFTKAELRGRHAVYLRLFAAETLRGELCHWAAIAMTPVFFIFNPLWADGVMIGYALAANLPCILAQRYNRARLLRLAERRSAGRAG